MISGYVYVITNEMFNFYGKNIYKIGTTSDIKQRAMMLSTSYLEPTEFVFISKVFPNKYNMETKIHKLLDKYRMNINKEFFQVPIDTIKTIIIELEDVNDLTKRMEYNHITRKEYDDIRRTCTDTIVKFKKPTKITNFPVLIDDITVYYAVGEVKRNMFKNTYKFKRILAGANWEFHD